MSEVLIVDDSLTVRMDLAGALESAGFIAVHAASLADARGALRERPIALAILDVRLPDGDGVELLREIRSSVEHASLPVLMLSSEAEVEDRIRGLKTGANDYVGKPYDSDLVIARVRQLVVRPAHDSHLVLVIDDSVTFREQLAASLTRAGYRIATASSGHDGLRAAASERPAAIIVDGVMPDMGGDLLIRRVRLDPALRAIPCLLLTGSDDAAAEIHALDAGADAFARKESDIDVVLARFAAMLRSARDARHDDEAPSLGSRRLLAVDDSPTYLHALADQLQAEGFDVVQAASGEQAIELLAVQQVDCILLDLMMPGLSGIETCRRIKAAPSVRDTPLIALTAHDGRDAMIEVLAAGADDFVSKASAGDVLGARVKAQIRRKKLSDEYRQVRERLLRSEREATEAHAARALAETRAQLAEQLARANEELAAANRALATANHELEAFSYSVSHDLRAPLRGIDGFSQALLDDYGSTLPEQGQSYLTRIRAGAQRMAELIDDLLMLSRVSRADLRRERVDLSAIAQSVVDDLRRTEAAREVQLRIQAEVIAPADPRLMKITLENLLGNAWKFTAKTAAAVIEFGAVREDGELVYFVRDNGAGFDMKYAKRLFGAFQRLHADKDFSGTGVGLATVQRIIHRHGGRIWAAADVGHGATFSFTLPG
jgi:two-component system, NtrC family, sensor kinase